MKKQLLLLAFCVFLTFGGCENGADELIPPRRATVYSVNEGNFSDHNGSISSYTPDSSQSVINAYQRANDHPLAGFIQTSTVIGNRLYVITNKPDQIKVMDVASLRSVGSIDLKETPTAMAPAGNGRAYVANLYGNSVTIVDLEKMEATGDTIAVGSNPYFAFNKGNNVFVSNNGFGASNTVSVIDTQTDKVTATLTVGKGPKQIAESPSGRLWVVCEGYSPYQQPEKAIAGGLFIIDPTQPAVVDSIKNGKNPRRIAFDARDSRVFVTYPNAVETVNLNSIKIANEHFIDRNFNTIGYSVSQRLVYAGQSKGLKQNGQAIRYNLQGSAVDSFAVGISPIEFHFLKK